MPHAPPGCLADHVPVRPSSPTSCFSFAWLFSTSATLPDVAVTTQARPRVADPPAPRLSLSSNLQLRGPGARHLEEVTA